MIELAPKIINCYTNEKQGIKRTWLVKYSEKDWQGFTRKTTLFWVQISHFRTFKGFIEKAKNI